MEKLRELIDYFKVGYEMKEGVTLTIEEMRFIESIINQPKHETVEQWEERTGETYPDDGPVWMLQIYPKLDNTWWSLVEYSEHKRWNRLRKDAGLSNGEIRLIVANHHGKPASHDAGKE